MKNVRNVRKRPKQPVVHQALPRHFPKCCSPLPVALLSVQAAVLLCLKVRANRIRLPQQKQGRKPTKMLKKAKTVTVLAPDPKVRKKMLLPRLTQKLMKIHLSLVEAAKENLPAHLWVKEKQCRAVAPEVANSRCPVAKKVEFLCARRQVFPILPVEPLNMTTIISERCTTVLQLISSVYWIRWLKKLPVSSWRLSVFENSTMLPRIFPTGTCMKV